MLGPTNIAEELASVSYNPYTQSLISTNAAECMKQHLNECVEFISDLHTINKVKVETVKHQCFLHLTPDVSHCSLDVDFAVTHF